MQFQYEIWSLICSNCPSYSIKKGNLSVYFFTNKPDEKQGEEEQKEELESELAEVASQAEESPIIPTEDKEPTQNQEHLQEDISTQTQQTTLPNPARTPSGRGRPHKTSPPSAQKKTFVKKEEESAAQDVPAFQDDPSDADYTPSVYIFIEQCGSFYLTNKLRGVFFFFTESQLKSAGSSSYMSSRGRRIRKPPRRNFPPGEQAALVHSAVSTKYHHFLLSFSLVMELFSVVIQKHFLDRKIKGN